MMRNRNNRLSFATLLAIAMTAGACSCGSDGGGTALSAKISVGGAEVQPLPGEGGSNADTYLLPFGNVFVGQTGTLEVKLTNVGSMRAEIRSIDLATPFSVDLPAGGLAIEPGASASVNFSFRPTEARVAETETTVNFGGGRVKFRLTGTGVDAQLVCSPNPVDFGNVEVRKSSTVVVECKNNTDLGMTVVAGAMEGTDRDYFSYGEEVFEGGAVVGAGETLRIPVTFAAQGAARTRKARFSLLAGDAPVTTIQLEGNAITSAIEIDPRVVDFGHVAPGSRGDSSFVIRNRGSQNLTVSALTLEASSSPAFSLDAVAPIVIPPDDPATAEAENEVVVSVSFAPTETGNKTAVVQIANDSNEPLVTATLKGFGGGPVISCTPGSLDFGPVPTGIPVTREYVCTNVGIEDGNPQSRLFVEDPVSGLSEFTARIVNPDGSEGARRDGYGQGEFFTVRVTYSPEDEGIDETVITMVTNDELNPVHETRVSAHGRDLPPCDFQIVPPNLRFGSVAPGRSAELEFAVRNNQSTECLIHNVRIENDAAGVFSVNVADYLIVPGNTGEVGTGDLRIRVEFSPPERLPNGPEVYTGEVVFEINLPSNPTQRVGLRGASQEPCALISPDYVNFGTVGPGCSNVVREVSVINMCDQAFTVRNITFNESASDEFGWNSLPTLPRTLQRGQEIKFKVSYRPEAVGEDIGSVFIHVDGNNNGTADDEEPYMAVLYGRSASDARQTDRFEQEDAPKVDLLWVIDNSGSMGPFQTRVAQNLAAFLGFALEQGIDFQLGVTTTGLDPTSGCPGGVGGGENGRLFPVIGTSPRILTPTTPNLEQHWATNVNVGTCHYDEFAFEAAYRALSPGVIDVADVATTPEPNDGNLGFLRREANLSIIFLSDESEWSINANRTVDFYYNFFMSIKGHRNADMFTAHAIAGDPGGCSGQGVSAMDGLAFHQMATRTGGGFQSICTSDWREAMEAIGKDAFGFRTRFYLTSDPEDSNGDGQWRDVDDEIVVFENGVRINSVNSRGARVWWYNPEINAVVYDPLFLPPPGTQIEITYTVACNPN